MAGREEVEQGKAGQVSIIVALAAASLLTGPIFSFGINIRKDLNRLKSQNGQYKPIYRGLMPHERLKVVLVPGLLEVLEKASAEQMRVWAAAGMSLAGAPQKGELRRSELRIRARKEIKNYGGILRNLWKLRSSSRSSSTHVVFK